MAPGLKRGFFVTFEGTEGSGKSTQSKMLTAFLKQKGFRVLHIWDPGSTSLGESVRKILLTPGTDISTYTETLLYIAARAQLVDEKILPALEKSTIVICDRFVDATVAYQGYGLGVDIKTINRLNAIATRFLSPDITFFLDTDIRKGLRRCYNVKGFADRIERRSYGFHHRVRSGYLALKRRFPHRIVRISVDKNDKAKTQQIIRGIVLDAITRHKRPR
jgi:dTMP kinase